MSFNIFLWETKSYTKCAENLDCVYAVIYMNADKFGRKEMKNFTIYTYISRSSWLEAKKHIQIKYWSQKKNSKKELFG